MAPEAPPRRPGCPPGGATGSTGPAALVTIDALGRKCPIPIIMLAERIGEVPVGEIIAVRPTTPRRAPTSPPGAG